MALTASPAGRIENARAAHSTGPRGRVGWLFIAPNLVGVALFTFIPLISVVVLAFTDWNLVSGLGAIEFIGVENFSSVLRDPVFWGSVGRTVVYAGVSVRSPSSSEWRSPSRSTATSPDAVRCAPSSSCRTSSAPWPSG